jgi:AraC-like DNA-binding protein
MDSPSPTPPPAVLYDFDVSVAPRMRAWRPRLDGVVEVLHARFTDHAYPMHAHDAWTLLLVDDGAVRYDLDRHERGAFGELVTLLPPRVPHNGASTSPAGFRKRVLYLDAGRLPARLVGASVDSSAIADPQLRRMVSGLHRALDLPGDELDAEARLALVIDRLQVRLGDPVIASRRDGAVARRLRDLLEADIVGGLSLRDAARSLHFSEPHLVRSFSREFGMSPHRYLVSRRVDLARRLLLRGGTVGAAAVASGFYDQAHLVRHFKRILGVSPAVYRRDRRG